MLNLRLSIKTKISAVITLSIVFVVLIMCSITVIYQINHMKEFENKILNDSVRSAATIAYTIMPYFVEKDFVAVNDLISYFSKRSDRAYLLVVDNNNRIMAHSSYAKTGSTFENPAASSTEKINDGLVRKYVRAGKESIEISYPIKAGDLVLGTVILGLNTDWMRKEKNIIRQTIFTSAGGSLAIILVGIMLGSVIADRIAKPILLLKQTAENVGKGDYNQTVYTRSRDEVGALADAFNKMLEELKDARAQLVDKKYVESIIANMNDALIVLSSEGRIKTVNKTTLNLLGYREDELINQPFGLVYQDSDFQTNGIFAAMDRGLLSMAEKTLISKEGRKIPALTSFAFMRGEGEPDGMVCVVKDITERKRFEEKLRESEERYRSVVENIGIGIAVISPDMEIISLNGQMKEWFPEIDLSEKHVCYRAFYNPPRKEVCSYCPTFLTLKDGQVHETITDTPAGDKIIHYRLTSSPIKDKDGGVVAAIEMVEDITKRKKSEEELKMMHIRMRTLVDAIPDVVFFKDKEGNHLVVNRAFEKFAGLKEEELVGKAAEELLPPDLAKSCRKSDQEVMKGRGAVCAEEMTVRAGEKIFLETIKVPVHEANGNCSGLVGVVRDITGRKIAEEQIMSALKEKEILLKEIHHRVKNNLQVVASMLHLQAGYIKDREARILFEESQQRVESMALLHEKLYQAKDLARIDFREYVVDLAGNLLALNTDKSEKIEMKLDIEGVILDVNNSIPCGLIINELVSNSLAHAFPDGRKGKIEIGMHCRGEGRVVLSVSDNGIGFPWNIDFRNTASLGMQLVNSLVSQLDGSIELDRSEGTSFKIEFQA